MEDNQKKVVKIVIIVVCLILAVLIYLKNRPKKVNIWEDAQRRAAVTESQNQ